MLKIYGSDMCPDCLQCKQDLDASGVTYEYHDIAQSLLDLKEFLKLRDTLPLFDDARREGYIGIPCILSSRGEVSLDWSQYVSQVDA